MRWIKRIVIGFFALIGVFVVAAVALLITLGPRVLAPAVRPVPAVAVLELDLTKPLAEARPSGPFGDLLAGERLTLRQIEESLERAGRDERIKGLVARLGAEGPGIATAQELRDAIAAFRQRGKFAVVFAESYGDTGVGSSAYYLAAAFEEIWLQPSGEVGLTGVVAETPFLKGTLDKLGVVPRFDKREEYKTAVNELTDTAYSPAFRESMESILGSLYGQLVKGVADGRGVSAEAVKQIIDRGPFLANEALQAKLVDRLGYRDEAEDAAKRRAGEGAQLATMRDYFRATRDDRAPGRVIALVTGTGPIVSGDGQFNGPFGAPVIGSDSIAKALDDAARARDVVAILFRIDSPGGDYVASDTIWRAVSRAKAAGKPVIVSMGDVAASGGYFIAAPATKIVAEPATLTGSIGVFGGKFVVKELFVKLGLTTDSVQFGANAAMWSPARDFTEHGWRRLEASLDAVYGDFTSKVAQGRGLDASRIPALAKGRVFTGEEAQKTGLVDALGGWTTALVVARQAAGLGAEEPVELRQYPRPGQELRRLLDQLFSDEGGTEARLVARLGAKLAGRVPALRPLLAELPALAASGDAYLLMPPLEVR